MIKHMQPISKELTDSLVIIIPAYNPNHKLSEVAGNLLALGFEVIVVDDGSKAEHAEVFAELKANRHLHLLHHSSNRGKGAALKTAIKFFKQNFLTSKKGFITVDADGQHSVEDVIKVGNKFLEKQDAIIIGSRKVKKHVPLRSKFGNIVTRFIFFLICGKYIYDTQSGLRALGSRYLDALLAIKPNRYEFELEILIMSKKLNIPVEETEIQTIYENNNESSHFNPIVDSLRIYFVFFRFLCNSMLTALVDYATFAVVHSLGATIAVSFVMARIVACSYNFYTNKYHVFKDYNNQPRQAIHYLMLVIFLMTAAYFGVLYLTARGVNVYLAKVIVEGSLFFVSFLIQRLWVFKSNLNNNK